MTAPVSGAEPAADQGATEFADKIFTAFLGTMETFSLYLGERLGWLDALASGPLTAAQLAERTRTAERYAVEWLEMQAVYGNLTVVDQGPGPREQRRFGVGPRSGDRRLVDVNPYNSRIGIRQGQCDGRPALAAADVSDPGP